MSVFISHPGQQHSHQLAIALHSRSILQMYISGTLVLSPGECAPFYILGKQKDKIKTVNIPIKYRMHPVFFQVLIKLNGLYLSGALRDDNIHRVFHAFDFWVAKKIELMKPKVVIGFENSSYHTFLAAKKIGAICILDAPALHHVSAKKILDLKPSKYYNKINERKDLEVSLADVIITCSDLAKNSYLENGVDSRKLFSISLGAELPVGVNSNRESNSITQFIFAGGVRRLKSIDLIISAVKRLASDGYKFSLKVAGGEAESGWVAKMQEVPEILYLGALSQVELYRQMAMADCLLLPSRFDSFGMVVAEAMACGTPAIVSTTTGAKEIIEKFPLAGWIIDCAEDQIYECMKKRILDHKSLLVARESAFIAAKFYTWDRYRTRVADLVESFL